jgi:hypothetical protein
VGSCGDWFGRSRGDGRAGGGDPVGSCRAAARDPGRESRAGQRSAGDRQLRSAYATDWPGYYPHGPEVVRLLIAAGADPNATIGDPPLETPLYWAASTDDVEIAEALIDGGTRTREHPHLPLSARHTVTDHAAARLDS